MIKLIHGNCLEEMKGIKDQSIDLILTDPPYGITSCKWDSVIPFDLMWEQLNRIIKPKGAIVLFGSEPFSSYLRMSNIKNYKYDWIWDKIQSTNFSLSKYQPMRHHELISVFSIGGHNYFPRNLKIYGKVKSNKNKSGSIGALRGSKLKKYYKQEYTGYPKSIIKISNANQKNKLHPTQKPVVLMEYLIKTYSQEGETVLDFTMGSGSTGVACMNTNRKFIGIEMDRTYFDIAEERISASQRKKKLFY